MALMSEREALSDCELRMTALAVAHESASAGQTTGGILFAADTIYRFLAGGTVVSVDGRIKVVSPGEALTRH